MRALGRRNSKAGGVNDLEKLSRNDDFRLLSDEPNLDSNDPLGFDGLSGKLADAILRSRGSTPFTLGIEGGWGCGKSSLMRRLERDLLAGSAVSVVWFNAWTAEGVSAMEGLIKTVLERMDPSILRRALRNRQLVSGLRFVMVALASWLGIGRLVDQIWDRVATDAKSRNELRDLMHDAMERWRKKHGGVTGDRLLVIFVDDLDRASPTQVFEIFESMKLYLDAPGFVFVVGYDYTIISEAVLEERKYSRTVTGREYIEKIVQIAYRLAPPDDPQAALLMEHYTADSGTASLFDEAARALVIDRNQRNPRRIKRFLNAFVLLYALDPDWESLGQQRLVEVLLLDMYFPEFSVLFRAHDDADPVSEFLKYRAERDDIQAGAAADADQRVQALDRKMPQLYPTLVVDDDFVSLVQGMSDAPNWEDVATKLRRRDPLATTPQAESVAASPPTPVPSYAPPSMAGPPSPAQQVPMQKSAPPQPQPQLCWIGDERRENRAIEILRSLGWRVTTSQDVSAILRPSLGTFDMVIVSLDWAEDQAARLDELARVVDREVVKSRIAVFSLRISLELSEKAEASGFEVIRGLEGLGQLVPPPLVYPS